MLTINLRIKAFIQSKIILKKQRLIVITSVEMSLLTQMTLNDIAPKVGFNIIIQFEIRRFFV